MTSKKDKNICSTKKCNLVALHNYIEEGCKKGSCLAHIPLHERNIFKAKRYEYAILNSIMNNLPDKYTAEIKHNQNVSKEIKSRPDLLLISKVTNDTVVIEVDEDYHFKKDQEEIDKIREKDLIRNLSEDGSRKVHIIRIVPMEKAKNKNSRMVEKDSLGIVIKNSNYDDIMDVVNSKIKKRLVGIVSPLSPKSHSRKITPINYKSLKSPGKRTLVSIYEKDEKAIVTSLNKFTDAMTDPQNWKYTYPKEKFKRSSISPIKKSSSSPTSLRESPINYISRQLSPEFLNSDLSLVYHLSDTFRNMKLPK